MTRNGTRTWYRYIGLLDTSSFIMNNYVCPYGGCSFHVPVSFYFMWTSKLTHLGVDPQSIITTGLTRLSNEDSPSDHGNTTKTLQCEIVANLCDGKIDPESHACDERAPNYDDKNGKGLKLGTISAKVGAEHFDSPGNHDDIHQIFKNEDENHAYDSRNEGSQNPQNKAAFENTNCSTVEGEGDGYESCDSEESYRYYDHDHWLCSVTSSPYFLQDFQHIYLDFFG